ncbi:MAG: periplasmic heavy metal sensor [Brevundimonas sp.]|nr:MAG: periplasmic heavy metal sensor [Brevundimonas sp.]
MTPQTWKSVLAVSVALNLFALAAGATLLVTRAHVDKRVEAQQRAPRTGSPMLLIGQLDPAVRDRVRDTLRASALQVRPDFEEARQKRREAVAIASSDNFDSARITTLLAQSREAELRGRARLEVDAVAVLETLEPADRKALSEILTRRGRVVVRRDREARPPAPAN